MVNRICSSHQYGKDFTKIIERSEIIDILWNNTWGGLSTEYNYGMTIDSNGYIYCIGYTKSFGAGMSDLALVKFYSNGTKVWNITGGGISNDCGWDVVVDVSGNIYCVGYTRSFGVGGDDLALLKFYSNGTKVWNIT
jgi:hypothetical protein